MFPIFRFFTQGQAVSVQEVTPNLSSVSATHTKIEPTLTRALDIIKNDSSYMAQRVWQVVRENQVTIQFFAKITEEDFHCLFATDCQLIGTSYPPSKKTLLKIESIYYAQVINNHIYIASNLKTKQMAQFIVHEVSHFLNEPIINCYAYADHDSEVAAFLAEISFTKKMVLTRSLVKKTHAKVRRLYPHLVHPSKKISYMVHSVYDTPMEELQRLKEINEYHRADESPCIK